MHFADFKKERSVAPFEKVLQGTVVYENFADLGSNHDLHENTKNSHAKIKWHFQLCYYSVYDHDKFYMGCIIKIIKECCTANFLKKKTYFFPLVTFQ